MKSRRRLVVCKRQCNFCSSNSRSASLKLLLLATLDSNLGTSNIISYLNIITRAVTLQKLQTSKHGSAFSKPQINRFSKGHNEIECKGSIVRNLVNYWAATRVFDRDINCPLPLHKNSTFKQLGIRYSHRYRIL